jgi:hypothetical protein
MDWGVIAKDLKPVYHATSEPEALDRSAELSGKWEKRYSVIIRLWENARAEFVPILQFDREIRTVICTTNAIESINARLRRAVNARGHFRPRRGRAEVPVPGDQEPGPDPMPAALRGNGCGLVSFLFALCDRSWLRACCSGFLRDG